MSAPAPKPYRLEDDPLWKEVSDLAEYMYAKTLEFPEEEKWGAAAKLRTAAADCLLWASLAIGNPGPAGREYDWAATRKYASALKTMYRFAGRQKFIELEPEIMVRLDKLLAAIETGRLDAIDQSEKRIKIEREKDLKPWHEKYEIWKKLNHHE